MLESQKNYSGISVTTRQKVAVAFLLSFILLMIGLTVNGMRQNLRESLTYGGDQKKIADLDTVASSTDSYLKEKDTDNDGLNDYDEMKVYGTSPFLPDTDGDGINDQEELKRGTNPNCPEGQACTGQGALYNANSGDAASTSPLVADPAQAVFTEEQLMQMEQVGQLANMKEQLDAMSPDATSSGSSAQVTAPAIENIATSSGLAITEKAQAQAILEGGASAVNLRAALLKAGIPQSQLNQISDEALLASYRDMLNKQK
jgi:hypothetical protein